MSNELHNVSVLCPYCGERIDVLIDDCGDSQQYIEDCQVCCRPINFYIALDEHQQMSVSVYSDDE
jgi:Cysteine-rich CPXCG